MYRDKVAFQPVYVGCQVHSPACSRHFIFCRKQQHCCLCVYRLAQLQLQQSLLAGQRLVGRKLGSKVSQLCQQVFPLLHLLVTVSWAANLDVPNLPECLQGLKQLLLGSQKAPASTGRGRGRWRYGEGDG